MAEFYKNMKFTEKYCAERDKAKPENKDKKVISDDAFAIGESIEILMKGVDVIRRKWASQ